MELIRDFKNLNKNDAGLAGGKGASLGEMTEAGIPVPPGFVVLTEAFEYFIKETDLIQEIEAILGKVNHKEIHTVEAAAEKIKALILSRDMPDNISADIKEHFKKLGAKYVAVRSSATAEDGQDHAWAGQLESYLNTTEQDLLDKVKHCWASLFTPRAIFYRFEKGLHNTKISVAVVVQKMVESEVSGIAFSVHPVTEDRNQLIIEAGFGLGEAIVSGSITPDSYVVEKVPRRIIDINISTQTRGLYRAKQGSNEWIDIPEPKASSQVLTEAQILELSEIILKIEEHYGFPCDIEWAYEAGKFYIVQSRPITTLSNTEDKVSNNSDEKKILVKAYTRNFSIIMQQAWFMANKEGMIKKLDIADYCYGFPYLYFMKNGVEEVWENVEANKWLTQQITQRFKSDPSFFSKVHKSYFQHLSIIEKYWSREIKTFSELSEFIQLICDGIADFVILYVSLTIDSLPEEEKKQANLFREKDTYFSECDKTIKKAIAYLYPDFGYLGVYITKEELGTDISKTELQKRDKGFALVPGLFNRAMSFEELLKTLPQYHFVIDKIENVDKGIHGQVAYKGKVSGRVRIVLRDDQIKQIQEGEIIVSPMTTPDMLPAMQKAIAFVTDEGGITCHAAIIAREMKKPCIIGTKIATQVLKDGDLVEVDAYQGIVKVLEENVK